MTFQPSKKFRKGQKKKKKNQGNDTKSTPNIVPPKWYSFVFSGWFYLFLFSNIFWCYTSIFNELPDKASCDVLENERKEIQRLFIESKSYGDSINYLSKRQYLDRIKKHMKCGK